LFSDPHKAHKYTVWAERIASFLKLETGGSYSNRWDLKDYFCTTKPEYGSSRFFELHRRFFMLFLFRPSFQFCSDLRLINASVVGTTLHFLRTWISVFTDGTSEVYLFMPSMWVHCHTDVGVVIVFVSAVGNLKIQIL